MPRPRLLRHGRTLPVLTLGALTLLTLAALFAMHGLSMSMSMSIPGSTSMSMSMSSGHVAAASMPTVATQTAPEPTAVVQGGCDAEHDGCLAVLRGQPQHVGAGAAVAVLPLTDAAALYVAERTGVEPRGSPPLSRPSLTELCISRT